MCSILTYLDEIHTKLNANDFKIIPQLSPPEIKQIKRQSLLQLSSTNIIYIESLNSISDVEIKIERNQQDGFEELDDIIKEENDDYLSVAPLSSDDDEPLSHHKEKKDQHVIEIEKFDMKEDVDGIDVSISVVQG